MSDRPRLSICVPSRNRQDCFRQTISDLIENKRPDVEFVLADNSDDPGIMDAWISAHDDPRIRYLASENSTLSMADNWERCVRAATGDWVTLIGDDDYIDLALADLLTAIEQRESQVEAVAWNRASFQWRAARFEPKAVAISLGNRVMRHPHDAIMQRLFGWEGATYVPLCPYGIYHGAVPRRTIDKMLSSFSGRLFEHPVVDYDFSHKLLTSIETLVYIDRPMSVLGVAGASNSAAMGKAGQTKRAEKNYLSEYGDRFERETVAAGFPFTVETGVAGSIMAGQSWFKRRYGFAYEGWEAAFSRAVSTECQLWRKPEEYERHVGTCRTAFEQWQDGRYLDLFKPRFRDLDQPTPHLGVVGRDLLVAQEIADVETPRAFYDVLQSVLPDMASLAYQF